MKFIYLLLISASIFAQDKSIEAKIMAITASDSNPKNREFTIHYEIENLTNNSVSFFLTPNTLIANAAASMTLFPVYKIYINDVFISLDGPFFEKNGIDWETKLLGFKDYTTPQAKEVIKKVIAEFEAKNKLIVENYTKNGGKSTVEKWILENHHLLESKITLNPKETKSFVIKTSWNRERYFKEDDLEYYLDEKDKYEFELVLDLKKTSFKEKLCEEEYLRIKKDRNFIEGIFTTNKVKIDFKEKI
ncbi:hypothetical protein O8E88_000520 [Flavobacterium psychrophilum]|uniref:hypothetical protein n=1 Tax=Flavobacterium psychrophilum TaxID=96345 RepID=UPI0004F75568|nr:hypothetical protein [Flavobacterium psychrophilum]AIN75239.1 hypothetical protein FPG3_12040 [Flavobacterium psychrophilum FPG3]EKT2068736.1 hypothetical protein [Flavobacterium psychrophilum]EKT2070960.1 hypothetical protein [Flavobacterium psychrophilum]EKT4490479.1 hypothetical protein [Flavobacterium psychrophilum]MBF2043521.1 hypothetical protein [Flavobacterium psychrophilum]